MPEEWLWKAFPVLGRWTVVYHRIINAIQWKEVKRSKRSFDFKNCMLGRVFGSGLFFNVWDTSGWHVIEQWGLEEKYLSCNGMSDYIVFLIQ